VAGGIVDSEIDDSLPPEEWDFDGLNRQIVQYLAVPEITPTKELLEGITKDKLEEKVIDAALERYEYQEKTITGEPGFREKERRILLRSVDLRWMQHIDDMEQLRQGIGLQSYGQLKPAQEYKARGFDMFEEMTDGIAQDTVQRVLNLTETQEVKKEKVAKETGTNKEDDSVSRTKKRTTKKIGRNDPCPCGSGKKYKNCCMKKDIEEGKR